MVKKKVKRVISLQCLISLLIYDSKVVVLWHRLHNKIGCTSNDCLYSVFALHEEDFTAKAGPQDSR